MRKLVIEKILFRFDKGYTSLALYDDQDEFLPGHDLHKVREYLERRNDQELLRCYDEQCNQRYR